MNSECFKNPAGNCTAGNPSDGFTPGSTSATAIVTHSVFLVEGIISMSGAVTVFDLAVIMRTLVSVAYDKRNRCSGCISFKDTRKNLYAIRFLSCCGEFALSGFPAVKECLYIITGKGNACRASIDNNTECRTMGFPPCCNSK